MRIASVLYGAGLLPPSEAAVEVCFAATSTSGDEPLAELLLSHGADASIPAEDGRTAADFARDGGHTELAERLTGREP